jgi:hypothetical protein
MRHVFLLRRVTAQARSSVSTLRQARLDIGERSAKERQTDNSERAYLQKGNKSSFRPIERCTAGFRVQMLPPSHRCGTFLQYRASIH